MNMIKKNRVEKMEAESSIAVQAVLTDQVYGDVELGSIVLHVLDSTCERHDMLHE